MNIWGCDLLQQQKTPQINIPPVLETNHKIKNASEKSIKIYYQEQSQCVQILHKEDKSAVGLSQVLTTLPLKWLADKPVWVEKFLTSNKLQALGQLIQERLSAQCIEE